MKLVLHNLVLRPHEKERALLKICEKKLHAPCKYFKILKKSLDARDKSAIRWVYSVECSEREEPILAREYRRIGKPRPKVIVVGAGPAGLFCAVRLIRHGILPILIERGKRVEEREADVMRLPSAMTSPRHPAIRRRMKRWRECPMWETAYISGHPSKGLRAFPLAGIYFIESVVIVIIGKCGRKKIYILFMRCRKKA